MDKFGIFSFGIKPDYLDDLIHDMNKDQNRFRLEFIGEYSFDSNLLPKLNDGLRFHRDEDEALKIAENKLQSNSELDFVIGITPYALTKYEYFNTDPRNRCLIVSDYGLNQIAIQAQKSFYHVVVLLVLAMICELIIGSDHSQLRCINSKNTSRDEMITDLREYHFCDECKRALKEKGYESLIDKSEYFKSQSEALLNYPTSQKSSTSNFVNNVISQPGSQKINWGKIGVVVGIISILVGALIPYYFYNLQVEQNGSSIIPISLTDNSILDSSNLLTLPSSAVTPALASSNEVFLTSVSNQKFIASPSQNLTLNLKVQYSTGKNPNQITQVLLLYSWSPSWPPTDGYYYPINSSTPLLSPGIEKEYLAISFKAPEKEGTYYLWLAMGSFRSMDDAVKSFKEEPKLPAHIKFLVKKN